MAELAQKERLQPSLLTRLTDDKPQQRHEKSAQQILSSQAFRQSVIRDLEWLLNTSAAQNFKSYPLVERSVLNYGICDLVGTSLSNADIPQIEHAIRQAIWDFEPRIVKESLTVKVFVDTMQMNKNAMTFAITGELLTQPFPLEIYLKTQLDLETGHLEIMDKNES
jgi:type VI secretion system protein ImpF